MGSLFAQSLSTAPISGSQLAENNQEVFSMQFLRLDLNTLDVSEKFRSSNYKGLKYGGFITEESLLCLALEK